MKKQVLYIEGNRDGYSVEQCGNTFTVGELIEHLQQFDEDLPVYIINDRGYTFGAVTEDTIYQEEENYSQ